VKDAAFLYSFIMETTEGFNAFLNHFRSTLEVLIRKMRKLYFRHDHGAFVASFG